MFSRFCLCLLCCLYLAACSSFLGDKDSKPEEQKSAGQLYNEGLDQFAEKSYKKAVTSFEEIERQHPYSEWASRGLIMAAYAQYKNEKYDDAVATLERFIKLYPANKQAPYAYYLRAICKYDQIVDVGRDQKVTQEALGAFQEVIRRFPDTEYARDAKLKLDLARDHLAGKEMEIGRYYLKQGHYVAGINRFRNVVENYQTTTHVAEALHRLTEAYLSLGVAEEAKKYAAVLGHNFPDNKWYRYSYNLLEGKEDEDRDSWLRRLKTL